MDILFQVIIDLFHFTCTGKDEGNDGNSKEKYFFHDRSFHLDGSILTKECKQEKSIFRIFYL